VVLDSWSRGPVLLVGDAAHATAPTLAQGAAMSFEDAVVLGEELRAAADDASAQLTQRPECVRTAHPIGYQAVIALECAQRLLRMAAEQPIGTDEVVADLHQLHLQRGDVVTGHRRCRVVGEHSIAKPPPRRVECGEGFRPYDPING